MLNMYSIKQPATKYFHYSTLYTFNYLHTATRVSFRGGGGGGGGGERGQLPPPWIFCAPLGFIILNDLPVYGQLTIRSNF